MTRSRLYLLETCRTLCASRSARLPLLLLLLFPMALWGCGYRPVISTTPDSPRTTMAVPLFVNHSTRPVADMIVTEAVIDRLRRSGYRIDEPSRADLVLTGTVDSLLITSVARSASDTTVLSHVEGVVSFTLTGRGEGVGPVSERFAESVSFPYVERQGDRLGVEDAALRELADRLALRILRSIRRAVEEGTR